MSDVAYGEEVYQAKTTANGIAARRRGAPITKVCPNAEVRFDEVPGHRPGVLRALLVANGLRIHDGESSLHEVT